MTNVCKSLEEFWKVQRTDYAAYKDGLYYAVEDVSGIDRALQMDHHLVAAIKRGYSILLRPKQVAQ